MWDMLIGAGGSIVAAAIIFLFSYWYNRKRQSDAAANEYTSLINEITNINVKFDNLNTSFYNLNDKIDNESKAKDSQYTDLANQITNLNDKFDNGFERLSIQYDELHKSVSNNEKSITNVVEANKVNMKIITGLTDMVVKNTDMIEKLTDIVTGTPNKTR